MRRQVRLILRLARKDVHLFCSDRRAALLSFAVPIILASTFGMVFHRPADEAGSVRLPVRIVDEDGSELSRALVEDLLADRQLNATPVDRATAESDVSSRRCGVAVIIPAGFASGLAARPSVTLLHHPTSAAESRWAEGAFTEAAMRRIAREYLPVLVRSGMPASVERPFSVERATPRSGEERFCSYSHSFTGMALQYLLFWGMESGLLLLRERRNGVWNRTRTAPVPLSVLLLGRASATALIALAMIAATFGFGRAVFGVTIDGSVIGFALMAVAVSCLAASTGLLVATLGGTEARARSVCILAILAVSMLGGLWLPAFLLPDWARDLSLALPTTWAMRGFDAVTWQAGGLESVIPCVAVVAGSAGVCLALAMGRFLWIESRRRRGWDI